MKEMEEKNYDELAAEYVEAVKKCNEKPTWDLIHTAYVCGATGNENFGPGDWKSRLVIEHDSLKKRFVKLVEFMASEKFFELPENHKIVLQNQKIAMEMYLQALNARLYEDLNDSCKQVPNMGLLGLLASMFSTSFGKPTPFPELPKEPCKSNS